jgi:hypothetical protein
VGAKRGRGGRQTDKAELHVVIDFKFAGDYFVFIPVSWQKDTMQIL